MACKNGSAPADPISFLNSKIRYLNSPLDLYDIFELLSALCTSYDSRIPSEQYPVDRPPICRYSPWPPRQLLIAIKIYIFQFRLMIVEGKGDLPEVEI